MDREEGKIGVVVIPCLDKEPGHEVSGWSLSTLQA